MMFVGVGEDGRAVLPHFMSWLIYFQESEMSESKA